MAGEEYEEGAAQAAPSSSLWVAFGDNFVPFGVLSRILRSASLLSENALQWEKESGRRRHSVQLRRLATLAGQLTPLALLIEGKPVQISEGDILSITDPGEGEDTEEQRLADRVDSPDDKTFLAHVYQMLRQVQHNERLYVRGERKIKDDIEDILDSIRNHQPQE